jgi:hypothetical protein
MFCSFIALEEKFLHIKSKKYAFKKSKNTDFYLFPLDTKL